VLGVEVGDEGEGLLGVGDEVVEFSVEKFLVLFNFLGVVREEGRRREGEEGGEEGRMLG
jgi:hypothetical protein